MQRRGLVIFIILNVIISLVVAFGAISFFGSQAPADTSPRVITVEIRITNTPDPNATIPVRIITATPLPGFELTPPQVAELPTDLLPGTAEAQGALPELDETALGSVGEGIDLAGTATALPPGCIVHVLQEGDTPFGVAEIYAADPFRLMEVNGLDDASATFLQVGDVLIVPLEGCPLGAGEAASALSAEDESTVEATPTPAISETAAPSGTPSPTIRPTVTLAPTAANAVMRIVEVLNPGDVTAESVAIRNTGAIVDIGGWTLSDADGNTYTFAEQRLFTNAQITLYTRVGTNSPVALYWGRDQAVFQPGDSLTLRDASGNVQATYRVAG